MHPEGLCEQQENGEGDARHALIRRPSGDSVQHNSGRETVTFFRRRALEYAFLDWARMVEQVSTSHQGTSVLALTPRALELVLGQRWRTGGSYMLPYDQLELTDSIS